MTAERWSSRASFVSRQARRRSRRRISRAVRRTRLSESPSLAVSALSKARTPSATIRLDARTAQPTEAIPMSKPKVSGAGDDLSWAMCSPIIPVVVAIRGESRCYNKVRSQDRNRIRPAGKPAGLFIFRGLGYSKGGRGVKLPNADQAIVDIEKLRRYCLDPAHPRGRHKARVFMTALGISSAEADVLKRALARAALAEEVRIGQSDKHGARYTFDLPFRFGAKSAVVRCHWMVRPDEGVPRLVTCYVV